MNNSIDLTDRIALVTGASSGIGQATAIALAACGASVSINYHRTGAGAEDACNQIAGNGGKAV